MIAIQKSWRKILNVDLAIETQDPLVIQSTIQKKSFTDLAYQGGIVATEPWALSAALFYPGSAQNWGNIDDPVVTKMIDTLKTNTNADQRAQLAQDINKRVLDEALQLFVDGYHTMTGIRPWLHTVAQSLYTQIDNRGGKPT
ncbi:MAG: hypothetical protein ACR2PL_19525 [Dehalococcoidia bacterium]